VYPYRDEYASIIHAIVRVHIGRGDVTVGSEDVADRLGEAPREPLLLAEAHHFRIALHAALRASERNVDHRGLPGHQGRKRAHLVEVGVRVVADAALVGTAGGVVLDAVAGEDLEVAVVHANRHLHGQLPVGRAEDRAHLVLEADVVGGAVEEVVDRFERVQLGSACGAGLPRLRLGDALLALHRSASFS
jgi:hypothetical protein